MDSMVSWAVLHASNAVASFLPLTIFFTWAALWASDSSPVLAILSMGSDKLNNDVYATAQSSKVENHLTSHQAVHVVSCSQAWWEFKCQAEDLVYLNICQRVFQWIHVVIGKSAGYILSRYLAASVRVLYFMVLLTVLMETTLYTKQISTHHLLFCCLLDPKIL